MVTLRFRTGEILREVLAGSHYYAKRNRRQLLQSDVVI